MNGLELHLLLLQAVIVTLAVFMYFVLRKAPGKSTNRLLGAIIGVITLCVMIITSISYRHYITSIKYTLDYNNVAAVYLNGLEIKDSRIKRTIVEQFNSIENVERNADGNEALSLDNWIIVQLDNGNRIQIMDMGNGEVQVHLGFPEYNKYDSFYTGEQQSLSDLISGKNN